MKIKIQLKDPDGFYDGIREVAKRVGDEIQGISDDTRELVEDKTHDDISEILSKWVEFGEYITIVFDTEEGTATVLEN
jgi:hypothetical protein